MPASWLRGLGDHQVKVPPELEFADWSKSLAAGSNNGSSSSSSRTPFSEGLLSASNIALQGEICALAVEPVLGYIAVGTTTGGINLFGKPSVHVSWNLRPANKVRHLIFKSGSPLLIVIDDKDNVSIFDLSRNDPQIRARAASASNPFIPAQSTSSGSGPSNPIHPDTPMRIAAHTARNSVICVEISPLHDHLFLGLRDGTIDAYDLDRLALSPYRVPNLWWEEEEILRKSGVPDAPNRRHVPLIIDIKTHPKDMNQLLLAYEGGVILLDAKEKTVLKTYQLRHLPGAVGSGVGNPDLIWTERSSPATCIAWRPDGLAFVCGHEDGCMSFWDVSDDSKPITVRTLELLDVDKPIGNPDMIPGGPPQNREPIFKLAWSGFPEQSWLDMAANATSKVQLQQQHQHHAANHEPTNGTILTVLGGATERHLPGLVCFHLPPFTWSYSSYFNSKNAEAMSNAKRDLRASFNATLETRYSTKATVEDFIMIPKDNPYFSLTYDPIAVIVLEAADPLLPPLPPPAAARGLTAFAFPPPSTIPPAAAPGRQVTFPQQTLNLPLALSTAGSGAIIGAKLVEVSLHAYRTLSGKRDVNGVREGPASTLETFSRSDEHEEDLILRGGTAIASVAGSSAIGIAKEELMKQMTKSDKHKILITWHLDGTIRFHDASPHLRLLSSANEEGSFSSTSPNRQDFRRSTLGFPASNAPVPGINYLEKGFPNPLPHLTISISSLIHSRSMRGHPIFERLKGDRKRWQIAKVDFAPEVLETAIVLKSGQVLIYKFGYARYSQTEDVREAVAEEVFQEEELAAEAAYQQVSPTNPTSPFNLSHHQQQHNRQFHSHFQSPPMSKLDGVMAGAMQELDSDPMISNGGSAGSPPPRPKRDPKRLSAAQRIANKVRADDNQKSASRNPSLHSPTASSSGSHHLPSPHVPIEEITLLGHLATWESDGFKPNILIELQRGEVTSLAMSDVGFLAIACGLALAIVDLRGPELIVKEGFGDDSILDLHRSNGKSKKEDRRITEEENKSPISALRFSICRTIEQVVLSPTLITVRENGFTSIWTLTKSSLDMWMCERSHGSKMDELAKSIFISVVDMAGNTCKAIPAELQRSLREQNRGPGDYSVTSSGDINLLFGASIRTLSLRVGLTGPRLSKAEVEEDLFGACIIQRQDEKVCMALSATSIRLFTLPHLQLIVRVPRHNRNREERLNLSRIGISFDEGGNFVEIVNSLDVRVWTIFATMPRPGLPSLLLYQPPSMPMAPTSINTVASSVVNWIGGKSSALTTGAQFDEVIAGSNRPLPPKLPEQKYIEVRVEEQIAREKASGSSSGTSTPQPGGARSIDGGNYAGSGGGIFAWKKEERKNTVKETQETADQASWNIDLAKQRGEMMNSLEEGLKNLEAGASGYLRQARQDLVKQAAKDKLTKFF